MSKSFFCIFSFHNLSLHSQCTTIAVQTTGDGRPTIHASHAARAQQAIH